MESDKINRPDSANGRLSLKELEEILVYFATSMFEQETESDLLWDIAHNCIARLGFVDCVIYRLDEARNVLVQEAALGPKNLAKQQIRKPIEIPVGRGITGAVAQTGKGLIIGDTTLDDRYIVDDQQRFSEIAVPILLGDQTIGVIDSEHPQRHYFTDQHLRILSAVASACAHRLRSIRAEEQKHQERQQLADLKAYAMKANLSPHFVFNALNAIQYFITAGDKDAAIRYLSTFSKFIRYHLKHYEAEKVGLEEELHMLEGYLVIQRMRYEGQLDFRLTNNVCPQTGNLMIPAHVLSPFLENVIEQLMYRSEGKAGWKGLMALNLEISDVVRLAVEYKMPPGTRRKEGYRDEFLSWKKQVRRLNRLKNVGITTETQISAPKDGGDPVVRIHVTLPILPI